MEGSNTASKPVMCAQRASKQVEEEQAETIADPVESAKAAGLRYVYDSKPGIKRVRKGKAFRYVGIDGKPVRDEAVLGRIKSLVIPPAWEDVWICPIEKGHLQATGRDVKGRKQSRYHPRWREVRDEAKYEHMVQFGQALPAIRERVDKDLARQGMPREKVLATIVRLMETTFIRIGNPEYARDNQSYGLTTMRRKHVKIEGATLHFEFKGKSGVEHAIDVNDRRLAKIVKASRDLPGYELFQYVDEDGEARSVGSSDVNDYLCEISGGQHFTAKDFRTWAGTVLACVMLREFEAFSSDTQAKKNVVEAIKAVSKKLGNTPSVCRKCYVHPGVLESYMSGAMVETVKKIGEGKPIMAAKSALREEEAAMLELLQGQLATA